MTPLLLSRTKLQIGTGINQHTSTQVDATSTTQTTQQIHLFQQLQTLAEASYEYNI